MKLILGVVDIPYTDSGKVPSAAAMARARASQKAPKGGGSAQTTGDVATILEAKYHVMETFYERHEEEVAAAMEGALAGELENILAGSPPRNDPYGSATSAIEAGFRAFLDRDEMAEAGIPGVPTRASRSGVNRRMKSGRGGPRPSFIDSGLYQASMVSWVEE